MQKLRGRLGIERAEAESLKESASRLQQQLLYETAEMARPGGPKPMLEVRDGRVVPRGSGG